jgi:hypothetical protein
MAAQVSICQEHLCTYTNSGMAYLHYRVVNMLEFATRVPFDRSLRKTHYLCI